MYESIWFFAGAVYVVVGLAGLALADSYYHDCVGKIVNESYLLGCIILLTYPLMLPACVLVFKFKTRAARSRRVQG